MSDFNFFLFVLISYYRIANTLDSCRSRSTCQECIRDPSLCVWCAKNDFIGTRCVIQNSTDNEWCPDFFENPNSTISASKNEDFKLDPDHIVQIKPQNYTMNLRPGMSESFEFSFQAALDFPVDLYFLFDASGTMSKFRNTVAEQTENIYNTMKNMTKNVHLGFGTFVDKAVLPFAYRFNETVTYSFRHRLKLTEEFTEFKEAVSNTPDGSNRDSPEGGLDALAQVMVCKDVIGWRDESRKIIIYISDETYHSAGDGKTAGLFKPYDGECYTENGRYTKEREMDYPSVGIIKKLAIQKNMVILFYVHTKVEFIYHALAAKIPGSKLSSFAHTPDKESEKNLVKTLKDIYEKISKKITLNVRATSGHRKKIEISFNPDCTSEKSGPECEVEISKEKHLVGTIKLLEYVEHALHLDVGIESIEEKLSLEINAIKNCDCDANVEKNSSFCNGEIRSCGKCDCGTKRYGEKCACERNARNTFNDRSTCIAKGDDDECSGHGFCECGRCRCREGFSGQYCNCNKESCPRDGNGKLCSGETNGECVCGTCKCKPEWTGVNCNCHKDDCKVDGKICNGRGDCNCGVCVCHEIPSWDIRSEDKNCKLFPQPDTHQLQCIKLESCAKCRRNEKDECLSCDENIKAKLIETLTEEYRNSTTWKLCPQLKVDIGCYSNFAYRYIDENFLLELVMEQDKNCAETYYVFGGALLLILLLVGVGMLVGWKLMIDARDVREYKQFLIKNKQEEGSYKNPIFQEPSSTFNNPAFRKRSVKRNT